MCVIGSIPSFKLYRCVLWMMTYYTRGITAKYFAALINHTSKFSRRKIKQIHFHLLDSFKKKKHLLKVLKKIL